MYSNVQKIRIDGQMLDVETDFNVFGTSNGVAGLSVVFGRNGSGKSTLADGFIKIKGEVVDDINNAELIDNSGDKIEVNESMQKNIHVFNESFIDKNIKMKSDGLDTIILFGEQVELDEKISKMINDQNDNQEAFEKCKGEKLIYEDEKEMKSPYYHKNEILKTLKHREGWAERDRYIRGNRRRSDVNDFIFNEISNLKVLHHPKKLSEKYERKISLLNSIKERGSVINEEVREINDIGIDKVELSNLLSQEIENPKLDERDKKIISLVKDRAVKEVRSIKKTFEQNEIEKCPYCFQDVTDKYKDILIRSIEKVLSKQVENHINELEKYKRETVLFDLSQYKILDIELINSIQEKIIELNNIIKEYNTAIDKKIDNIYKPVFINVDHSQIYNELIKELKELEIKRREFNYNVQNKKKLKEDLIKINKERAHLEIISDYNIYKKRLKEYNDISNTHSILCEKKEEIENNISSLRSLKDQTTLAVDIINNGLKYIFFTPDRLYIEPESKNYILYSNGKPVKPEKISVGERNAIALCYYFTHILNNLDESQLYKNDNLLVIDDPISSFDKENQMGVLSYLKLQLGKVLKGNSKSKVLVLSHDLLTVDNIRVIYQELESFIKQDSDGHKKVKSNRKIIRNFVIEDFTKDDNNDYSQLLRIIYEYGEQETEKLVNSEDNLVIGNIMRRVLEAFAIFEYKVSIDSLTTDKKMLEIIPKEYHEYFDNLMYRIILNQESHLRDRSFDPSKLSFYDYLSFEEKQQTARSILVLINILNPHHLKAHLDSNNGAREIETIREWEESIKCF